jgi:uncharacterized protein (TIGR03083 family)
MAATLTVSDIQPISRRTDAAQVALATYEQLLALLEDLPPHDWGARTECPDWDVADMVGHLIGGARAFTSLFGVVRWQVRGLRNRQAYDGNSMDAANALEVSDHAALTPAQRIATLREVAPRAVKGRMRLSRYLGPLSVPVDQSGSTAPGTPTRDSLGRLFDVVLTRDVWLHTVDIARAVGREPEVAAPVDGRIVEDVVAEWAHRHGQPFELLLRGPAGGAFRAGTGGERIEMDVVTFARTLSGRAPGEGLLATRVLF